jgi:hypothetical protein
MLSLFSTLKMEAVISFEKSANFCKKHGIICQKKVPLKVPSCWILYPPRSPRLELPNGAVGHLERCETFRHMIATAALHAPLEILRD